MAFSSALLLLIIICITSWCSTVKALSIEVILVFYIKCWTLFMLSDLSIITIVLILSTLHTMSLSVYSLSLI